MQKKKQLYAGVLKSRRKPDAQGAGEMARVAVESGFYQTFELVHRAIPMEIVMPPHVHDALEIYLVMDDVPGALVGAEMIPFPKHTLLIIPPGCVHKIDYVMNTPYERYILTIGGSWLKSILGDAVLTSHAWLFDPSRPIHRQLTEGQSTILCDRFNALEGSDRRKPFLQYQLLFQTLSAVCDMAGPAAQTGEANVQKPSGSYSTVAVIIDYINTHLGESLTTEKIAEALYINHDYASRIFKKHVHITIKHYITLERLSRAKALLEQGYSITETQLRAGYSSYEHFLRTFKKNTGMTPREYQKRLQRRQDESMPSEIDRDLLL